MTAKCECSNSDCKNEHDLNELKRFMKTFDFKQEGLISLLQKAQEIYGYLPYDVMEYISSAVQVPEAEIYGVVTFYSQFRLKPIGEHHIKICCGTACHVGGAEEITTEVCRILNVKEGETTEDGKFTVEKVACLGCCSLAPVIMIDGEVFGRLKPSGIAGIISKFRS
jgi:NADH-quinone oxidoreductase subunit E